jgi:hypothetical protein
MMPPSMVAQPSGFKDFLTFRRMITPVVIQVIFWLGLVGVLVGSVVMMTEEVLLGLGMLVGGPIVLRIYCELLILFFRVNETLTDIRTSLNRR